MDGTGPSRLPQQIWRYGLVGVFALGLDVGVFALLRWSGLDLVSANVCARLAGAFAAHGGNYFWTFGGRERGVAWRGSALRYALLWLAATSLSTGVLALLDVARWGSGAIEAAVKLAVECCIVVLNFVIARLWVFR